ncbi:hypothetical protein M3Y97_00020100 [Aphelenchoides bicaudatus]|nr:hypothetical protein M3Y97_00020100 [Aphelenchoides bicaudatus]
MSSSSDEGQASDSDGPSKPSTSQRPKRSAPKQSFVETDSSGSDDNAVKIAKMKAKKPRKSAPRSTSPEDFLKKIDTNKAGQLNELEREQLIFEQMEKAEIDKRREEIRKQMNKSKRGKNKGSNDEFDKDEYSTSESEGEIRESKRNKKPASMEDEDPDMGYHRPSEVHAKKNKKKAMDELMSKRREKKEADEKRKEQQEKNRAVLDVDELFGGFGNMSSSSSRSSRSSSVSSDRSRSVSSEKNQEVDDVKQLSQCKISRIDLARFVHLPFFNDLAIGCYVRVGIGQHNGRSVYRIAEITDVVETAKVYGVEKTRTNKGLRLKHGADQKVYRLEFISNQAFEEKEWTQWLKAMRDKNVPLPTVRQVNEKQKKIKDIISRNLDANDIDYMVKEKQRFMTMPTNFAIEKSRLMKMKADFEAQSNHTKAKEVQKEIDELDATADRLEHERNKKLSGVALINQKRRIEMKQNFLDPNRIVYDPVKQDDPFTRKSNRTRVVSGLAKKNDAEAEKDPATSTKSSDSQGDPSSSTPAPSSVLLVKKFQSTSIVTKPAANSGLAKQFAAHAVELDLDI